jgi:hypothetical protein
MILEKIVIPPNIFDFSPDKYRDTIFDFSQLKFIRKDLQFENLEFTNLIVDYDLELADSKIVSKSKILIPKFKIETSLGDLRLDGNVLYFKLDDACRRLHFSHIPNFFPKQSSSDR